MKNIKTIEGWRKVIEGDTEKPSSPEFIQISKKEYQTIQDKLTNYEQGLIEIVKQEALSQFLDENDWAIPEDYFAHVAKKALNSR